MPSDKVIEIWRRKGRTDMLRKHGLSELPDIIPPAKSPPIVSPVFMEQPIKKEKGNPRGKRNEYSGYKRISITIPIELHGYCKTQRGVSQFIRTAIEYYKKFSQDHGRIQK